jgi:hypothetical protein
MNNKQKFENIKQVKYVLNLAIEKIAKNNKRVLVVKNLGVF